LLCIPVAFLAWQAILVPRSGPLTGSLPRTARHTDFIVAVGSFTLTGWQMWAVASGLALGGVLLGIFGFCVLSAEDESR